MKDVEQLQKRVLETIGETMILMQKLEALVKLCLLVIHGQRDLHSTVQKVLALDRKTLGKLLASIKERVVIPAEEYEILILVLAKRNLFVHELFLQPFFDMHTVGGLKVVESFCYELLGQSRRAVVTLLAFCTNPKTPVHLSTEEAIQFDKIMTRIVLTARPDFGGLTFEQYIDKIQKEADHIRRE